MVSVPALADTPTHTPDGFALPQSGHAFSFPRDHGSHDDFKIEWWYITGHLFGDDGRRFGFQATFFRSAASPTDQTLANNPGFGHEKLFLAHMALLDVKSGNFIHQQRLNRDGWDAFSATNGLDVRNSNWSLRMTDTNRETMDLHGSFGNETSLQLELQPRKPLVIFGQNSVSRKAADPSAASYYLTFPRLQATGEVRLDAGTNHVHGEAWMDHEISSSQLGTEQAGWDWCCLQFKDGREIMAYRMRRKDGTQDPYSTLAWVSTNDIITHLPSTELKMETVCTWKSPVTGAVYPVSIRLQTRDPQSNQPVSFLLEPLADNQELAGNGGPVYWEGACRIRDEAGKELGSAFLELTGYDGNLQKSLR
ncbi:MAG TPA: lipocalin-like domain-containing protein [Verrucomicrobiae bacterium]|nr:lipocalin-like domain-containing protein [Verrucomicrobiae bacterium]